MSGDEKTAERSQTANKQDRQQPGADEVFCTECGSVIKERAEVCPECGVRQQSAEANAQAQQNQQAAGGAEITDRRKYELEKMASKDKTTIAVIGFLISPVAYWMVGKKALAVVNFLTLNYFLLGVIVVPIHCYSMISDAEEELRKSGVGGY